MTDTSEGGVDRVYLTPTDRGDADRTPEGAISEGRVRTEEQNFTARHGLEVQNAPNQNQEAITKAEQEASLLAGKFKDAKELEKGYKELESKLGQANQDKPSESETGEATSETENAPQETLFDKGYQEWQQTGEMSEDTVMGLVDAGVPEQYIRAFVESANAQAELTVLRLQNTLGGEENVNNILNWAKGNLSPEEISAYNEQIESGEEGKISTAFKSMEARMQNTTSPQNRFIQPDAQTQQAVGYNSKAEMTADMNNPQYKRDPAFREMVARKLSRSGL